MGTQSHITQGTGDGLVKIYPGQGLFDSSFQISEGFQLRAELDLFVIPPEDGYKQM